MPRSEFMVVTRFEIPAESVFFRWPKHEVWRDFDTNRVHLLAVGVGVDPLGGLIGVGNFLSAAAGLPLLRWMR
jgi:hypothetical protein